MHRKPSFSGFNQILFHSCGKFGHWKNNHNADSAPSGGWMSHGSAAEMIANSELFWTSAYNNSRPVGQWCKTVNSDMALGITSKVDSMSGLGPLVDESAENSSIGLLELMLLFKSFVDTSGFYPMTTSLKGVSHWQLGTGERLSSPKLILGSIILSVQTDNNETVNIRHIVVSRSR